MKPKGRPFNPFASGSGSRGSKRMTYSDARYRGSPTSPSTQRQRALLHNPSSSSHHHHHASKHRWSFIRTLIVLVPLLLFSLWILPNGATRDTASSANGYNALRTSSSSLLQHQTETETYTAEKNSLNQRTIQTYPPTKAPVFLGKSSTKSEDNLAVATTTPDPTAAPTPENTVQNVADTTAATSIDTLEHKDSPEPDESSTDPSPDIPDDTQDKSTTNGNNAFSGLPQNNNPQQQTSLLSPDTLGNTTSVGEDMLDVDAGTNVTTTVANLTSTAESPVVAVPVNETLHTPNTSTTSDVDVTLRNATHEWTTGNQTLPEQSVNHTKVMDTNNETNAVPATVGLNVTNNVMNKLPATVAPASSDHQDSNNTTKANTTTVGLHQEIEKEASPKVPLIDEKTDPNNETAVHSIVEESDRNETVGAVDPNATGNGSAGENDFHTTDNNSTVTMNETSKETTIPTDDLNATVANATTNREQSSFSTNSSAATLAQPTETNETVAAPPSNTSKILPKHTKDDAGTTTGGTKRKQNDKHQRPNTMATTETSIVNVTLEVQEPLQPSMENQTDAQGTTTTAKPKILHDSSRNATASGTTTAATTKPPIEDSPRDAKEDAAKRRKKKKRGSERKNKKKATAKSRNLSLERTEKDDVASTNN